MKKLLCFARKALLLVAGCVGLVVLAQSGAQASDFFGGAYNPVTQAAGNVTNTTGGTAASSTPAIIIGTQQALNFNQNCGAYKINEHTNTQNFWIQKIMTKGGSANPAGPWIPIQAGGKYSTHENVPAGGIAVVVTGTATIDFESKL